MLSPHERTPMRLLAQSHIACSFDTLSEMMLKIEAAHAPGQTIVDEQLTITPTHTLKSDTVDGDRLLRGHVEGQVEIAYRALVDVEPRAELHAELIQHDWSDLPADVLPYLMPSRYAPSDQFMRFVGREFGTLSGGATALAIIAWLQSHLDYVHGVSTATTTAEQTFVDRAGVCRDFTHLGISLCRAAGIPARAVAAYALALNPPDFHAVFEVWLGDGWWLIDPTGLAPIAGLIRIAHGRDAADIAFMTTTAAAQGLVMTVSVVEV